LLEPGTQGADIGELVENGRHRFRQIPCRLRLLAPGRAGEAGSKIPSICNRRRWPASEPLPHKGFLKVARPAPSSKPVRMDSACRVGGLRMTDEALFIRPPRESGREELRKAGCTAPAGVAAPCEAAAQPGGSPCGPPVTRGGVSERGTRDIRTLYLCVEDA